MNSLTASFDWSHVRAFLAVAEHGSLSAAARALGTSQPTVGRQVHAMEAAAGTALFERRARGMVLTAAGADLLEPARDMAKAAGHLALRAAGAGSAIGGTVRITASVFSSHHILPPILARIREAEPEIAIELVASDTTENLLYREADIAVRMYRPRQMDIVTRHIGDLPLGIFGARHYLDRAGRPGTPDDLMSHQFVGYDRNEDILRGFRNTGHPVDREFFRTRCDHQTVYWELVRAGCGLGFAQIGVAATDSTVERVLPEFTVPALEVWLSTHEALRRTPRIRRVWDILADGLEKACGSPL
jgi:DNA-binding transcriptional LysR family regulator